MRGALPSQHIKKLIEDGNIKNGNKDNVQPASLDLTIGETIYRLPHIFLPKHDQKVEEVAKEIGAEPFTFDYALEVNTLYLVKLKEELELPENVYAYANPKSSVGRIDLKVTMLADGITRFDAAGERGYKGELWAIIEPKSFRVKLSPGETLLQLRLFYSDTRIKDAEKIEVFYNTHDPFFYKGEKLPYKNLKIRDGDGSLIMTIDLNREIVGWRCGGSQKFLDLTKRGCYDPEEFFTPIPKPQNDSLALRRGDFYILYTKEAIRIPPKYAAEIAPMDARSGEYRSHYAGFIDPGFGHGKDGKVKGAPIVLEIRPYESSIVLRDGQPVCKVQIEEVAEMPDIVYGAEIGSNYASQSGPRLSKHFKVNS